MGNGPQHLLLGAQAEFLPVHGFAPLEAPAWRIELDPLYLRDKRDLSKVGHLQDAVLRQILEGAELFAEDPLCLQSDLTTWIRC